MPPCIRVETAIAWSVIWPLGVRSWNATDSASSVSDRYSITSNSSTFLGTFIETPITPWGIPVPFPCSGRDRRPSSHAP